MVLRGIQYYFVVSLLVVASVSAKNESEEWLESDEENTLRPPVRGDRKTTTSEWEIIPRTTRKYTLPTDAEDFNTVKTPSTAWTRGNRRTTASTWEFISRTSRKYTLPTRRTTTDVSIVRNASVVPTSSAFTPTNNFTGTVITLLKNFAKFSTSDHPSSEDGGNEYFVNVLRLEIFTIATGNHFVVPPTTDESLEQKQRKKAAAVTALWLDLFCTENVDAILNNVTREAVVQYSGSSREGAPLTMNTMPDLLQTSFSKLNNAIEADSFLDTMYTAEEIRYSVKHFGTTSAESRIYIPFSNITQGRVDDRTVEAWMNDFEIRKVLIHRQFLDMRKESGRGSSNNNEDDKNDAWVRSVLKVARERCCIAKMEKIYEAALNETAKNFVTTDFPAGTIRLFVDKLTKAIEADDTLKTEWVKLQKNGATRETVRAPRSQKH